MTTYIPVIFFFVIFAVMCQNKCSGIVFFGTTGMTSSKELGLIRYKRKIKYPQDLVLQAGVLLLFSYF